jgi:lysozyme family protein
MTIFEKAFQTVIGEEGGLSTIPADPGNWTGGACGKGECRGTKFGIAASAHPGLDIASLTLDQARNIYRASYWEPLQGDKLPPPLALLAFDAAVNCGGSRAVQWLQMAADVTVDGLLGPETMAAIQAKPAVADLCAEFQAQRLIWMAGLPTWRVFGLGWARRLCHLCIVSPNGGDS